MTKREQTLKKLLLLRKQRMDLAESRNAKATRIQRNAAATHAQAEEDVVVRKAAAHEELRNSLKSAERIADAASRFAGIVMTIRRGHASQIDARKRFGQTQATLAQASDAAAKMRQECLKAHQAYDGLDHAIQTKDAKARALQDQRDDDDNAEAAMLGKAGGVHA